MSPLDLLSWPDLKDAELRVQAARLNWERAQRRYWFAPKGQRQKREIAVRTASEKALRAEIELASLQRERDA